MQGFFFFSFRGKNSHHFQITMTSFYVFIFSFPVDVLEITNKLVRLIIIDPKIRLREIPHSPYPTGPVTWMHLWKAGLSLRWQMLWWANHLISVSCTSVKTKGDETEQVTKPCSCLLCFIAVIWVELPCPLPADRWCDLCYFGQITSPWGSAHHKAHERFFLPTLWWSLTPQEQPALAQPTSHLVNV